MTHTQTSSRKTWQLPPSTIFNFSSLQFLSINGTIHTDSTLHFKHSTSYRRNNQRSKMTYFCFSFSINSKTQQRENQYQQSKACEQHFYHSLSYIYSQPHTHNHPKIHKQATELCDIRTGRLRLSSSSSFSVPHPNLFVLRPQ